MSIETLPVEIFHRIFDYLDAPTLVLSVRSVCRLFHAVVHTYDRYVLDFKSMSKSDFRALCRLIHPQKVRSLTLCNADNAPDQITLFFSSIRLRQLSRLHSLSLSGVDELQMNVVFKRLNIKLLQSFSLEIEKYDNRRKKTTLSILSSIIAQPNLKKVRLNLRNTRVYDISWPLNCSMEYLAINGDVPFETLSRITSCSSQLRTLKIRGSSFLPFDNRVATYCFSQLTSLSVEELETTNDQVESFLRLTPSLTDLKLMGKLDSFDGKRWEEFCQIYLSQLTTLQFFLDIRTTMSQTEEELDRKMEAFRSPFWIEYKQWLVACEYHLIDPHRNRLYSIPVCRSVLDYQIDSNKRFLCNSSISWDEDPFITTNVNELHLALKSTTSSQIQSEKCGRRNALFPNVTKLHSDIPVRPLFNSTGFLFTTIDICKLIEVKLQSYWFNKNNKSLLFNIVTALQQASHLSSLIIHSRFSKYGLYPYLDELCSIIPFQIKYLQIPIAQIRQVEVLLQRCSSLLLVQFDITRMTLSQEVTRWFMDHTSDSTFRRGAGCDTIWIGKKISAVEHNPKRMKFTDDQQLQS